MFATANITEEITIREYDCLFRAGDSPPPPLASLGDADWNWLYQACLSADSTIFQLRIRGRRQCLQARNYVGTVETPSGVRIEILPKTTDRESDDHSVARTTLLKMLKRVMRLKMTSWREANLKLLDQPLHEILISLFLSETERLMKKGLRSQYSLLSDEQPFLRGRLRVEQQLNRRPGAKPEFAIEYHEFLRDRPENRLIHSAVVAVSKWARDGNNQRRARALRFQLDDIPTSSDHKADFLRWSNDRSLIDYRELRPWCELVLREQSPHTLAGESFGMSFLFPMEQLFERYVAAILRRSLPAGYTLKEQAKTHALVQHRGQNWFWLRPDLIILDSQKRCCGVLDTKWKRLDEAKSDSSEKYGMSQSDIYQMAAYGQNYLNGEGDIVLIYPRSDTFREPLDKFEFSPELRLWAVPFDLETDELVLSEETRERTEAWMVRPIISDAI